MPGRNKIIAYIAPFAIFAGFLALNEALHKIDNYSWLSHAEFWIYPLQTIICGLLVIYFRREYNLAPPQRPLFGIAIAILTVLIWISPQAFFGYPPRNEGFNPDFFATNPTLYWTTIAFRFLRLVLVVPLIEEIFWRGFLLRYFVDSDFTRVPIGVMTWLSFTAVTILFMFSHTQPDWIAAAITGVLFNLVAMKTRSLATCVLTHAVTNLLLGGWIMQTRQWGFW